MLSVILYQLQMYSLVVRVIYFYKAVPPEGLNKKKLQLILTLLVRGPHQVA